MSGHSKWHSIKHKKAKEDAKRGNLFGKLSRSIIIATREGGSGDPKDNMSLANAIAKAKEFNMPQDNIDRAVKKGTGETDGVIYETILYEGYGPGGIAIIIETMTENRNRTTAEIRNVFSKLNGNFGESGSVSWQFEMKGIIVVDKSEVEDEDGFMLEVIDIGAEDIEEDQEVYEIKVLPIDYIKLKEALKERKIKISSSEVGLIPKATVKLDKTIGIKAFKLMNALDELDDVQNVQSNLEISDEILNGI